MCPTEENKGESVVILALISVACLVGVVLYALFNHKVPKGLLKPFINGVQYLTIVIISSTAGTCWRATLKYT